MTESRCVSLEHRGAVGIIRLTNPEKLNALTYRMREEFVRAFYSLLSDSSVRSIYITGEGRGFCAGGDLKILREENDSWSSYRRLSKTSQWLTDLFDCPKPIVVGVNGLTVGGGIGLTMAGDIVYAAEEHASFMSGFMRLGLVPDFGMMYHLPRRVGLTRAKAFIYSDEKWTAQQAVHYGLVTEAVPAADLEELCLKHAQALAQGPVEGFELTKRFLNTTYETTLQEMMTHEGLAQSVVHSTLSAREGIAAVSERRVPDFVAARERQGYI